MKKTLAELALASGGPQAGALGGGADLAWLKQIETVFAQIKGLLVEYRKIQPQGQGAARGAELNSASVLDSNDTRTQTMLSQSQHQGRAPALSQSQGKPSKGKGMVVLDAFLTNLVNQGYGEKRVGDVIMEMPITVNALREMISGLAK